MCWSKIIVLDGYYSIGIGSNYANKTSRKEWRQAGNLKWRFWDGLDDYIIITSNCLCKTKTRESLLINIKGYFLLRGKGYV